MKKLLILTLLIFTPLTYAADFEWTDSIVVSSGYTDPFHRWDDDNTKAFVSFGLESENKYPWTLNYTFVPRYSIVESHSSVGVGKQARYYFNHLWYVYGEFGLQVSDKTSASSTHFNFYETVGVAYRDFRLSLRHISNAGLGNVNEGEDLLFISYVF